MSTPKRPVLVTDDEPDIRDMLKEFLEQCGYAVLTATNGLEALWAVKHRSPGLVLLDLAMPRLGGLDTIKHIQKFDPSIRIVVVTGHLTRDDAVKLRDLGVPIVPKPVDFEVLRAMMP